METLQSLRSKLIANGDSSHCGGQFEWVDGQLVEALKSGYWLLIDNVNFCRYFNQRFYFFIYFNLMVSKVVHTNNNINGHMDNP